MRLVKRLYYGDKLDVLRQHIGTESVDLVYLSIAELPAHKRPRMPTALLPDVKARAHGGE
jgi:hypothetical protein